MTIEQLPPHNREAEEAVLGSLLIDPDAIYDVASFLKAEMFHSVSNKQVYEAIVRLYDRREAIDTLTVLEELRRHDTLVGVGGEAYVVGLVSAVPTSMNAVSYGHIVEEAAARRGMLIGAGEIARLAYNEEIETAEAISKAQAVAARWKLGDNNDKAISAGVAGLSLVQQYEDALSGKPPDVLRLPWKLAGWIKFKRGNFTILGAARPAMGKTSLVIQAAHIWARLGYRVRLYSMEMTAEEVVSRIASHITGIAENRLTYDEHTPPLSDEEWQRFYKAVDGIKSLPLDIIDTGGLTVQEIVSDASRAYLEHGDRLIVMVDYLQLVRAQGFRANEEFGIVSEVSCQLKSLAKNYGIWVFASAQLSRELESRTNKRPILSDLRQSGQIEQDADVVIALYRDEYYTGEGLSDFNGIAELIVLKYRGGKIGTAQLRWIGEQVMFDDL